jgi:hypothetical protein
MSLDAFRSGHQGLFMFLIMTSSSLARVSYVDRSRNSYCQTILRKIVTFEATVLLARHPHDIDEINDDSSGTDDDVSATSISHNASDASLSDSESSSSYRGFGRHVNRVVWMTDSIVFEYVRHAEVSCGSSSSSSLSFTSRDDGDCDASCTDSVMSGSEHYFGRHITRFRWTTANILFEYEKTCSLDRSELSGSMSSSPHKLEDVASNSCTLSAQSPIPLTAKRSRYTCS